MTPTIDQIEWLLPEPPNGLSYEVERFNLKWFRVWLVFPAGYFDYKPGPVKSIWGWVDNKGLVFEAAGSSEKQKRKPLCQLTEANGVSPYCALQPDLTKLPTPD